MSEEELKKTSQVIVNMTLDEDALKRMAVKIIEENDFVKVVRCKDCKYYHKDAMMPVHPMLGGGTVIENHCDMSCMKLKDDDYCSYGERKEQEHE